MIYHVINEAASPLEALVWKMWCGLEVVALSDGGLIPHIDFYHENAADLATCQGCKENFNGTHQKLVAVETV